MSDARTITFALGGKFHGGYGVAFCPAHDNTRTPALRLKDGGEGRLLVVCARGCTFAEILSALRGLRLVDGAGRAFAPDPIKEAARRAAEAEEAAKRTEQARRCWNEAGPVAGTLSEAYLRFRGITGLLPDTLRFHGACWHPTAQRLPALVGLVEGGAGFAVHRTYLAEPGRKASVDPVKAMLGAVTGGAVRLCGGVGPLVVCEGIETGLALCDGLAGSRTAIWAALSTSGMAGLRLPSGPPGELVIAPDGDAPGAKAADQLARRAYAVGWQVGIADPPGEGLDWADLAASREGVPA